jgi:hypothetical protein
MLPSLNIKSKTWTKTLHFFLTKLGSSWQVSVRKHYVPNLQPPTFVPAHLQPNSEIWGWLIERVQHISWSQVPSDLTLLQFWSPATVHSDPPSIRHLNTVFNMNGHLLLVCSLLQIQPKSHSFTLLCTECKHQNAAATNHKLIMNKCKVCYNN